MMKPAWLEWLDEARAGKTRGYVLDGNVADKVFYPESGIPPIPLKYFLAAYLAKEGYATGYYSIANGFEELRPPTGAKPVRAGSPFSNLPQDTAPEQALAHMTRWLRNREQQVALILDYADHMAPSSQGMNSLVGQMHLAVLEVLHAWGLDENIRSTKNLVFLVSHENQVSGLLLQSTAGYKKVSIGLPQEAERLEYIRMLAQRLELSEIATLSPEELGRVTSGLPYADLEELLHTSARRGRPLDYELIRDRKAAAIKQLCHGLLEVHEPTCGFEGVSGLEHAKEELGRVVHTIRTEPKSATQSLLLVGVPGCGKSHLVGALARELGYPCLVMRNVREGLVGASEANLERVLWAAETLSPCIMWIDEIDQIIGQRNTGQSTSGGTDERMMARIWEFMGSMKHRGRILWLGTSNRPDILDAALLDRFQVVIPFLHPTSREIEAMLDVLAQQVGRTLGSDVDRAKVATLPSLHNPTVRSLQEIVARAATLTDADTSIQGSPIDQSHLEEAAADFKPNYNPLQHQLIALNAIAMTSFLSVLPWRGRSGLRPGAEIPDYLADIVDASTGAVDIAQLNRQMVLLASALQREQASRQF